MHDNAGRSIPLVAASAKGTCGSEQGKDFLLSGAAHHGGTESDRRTVPEPTPAVRGRVPPATDVQETCNTRPGKGADRHAGHVQDRQHVQERDVQEQDIRNGM